MPDLYLHNRKLDSIFDLLGEAENDLTASVGWALAYAPLFLAAFLSKLFVGMKGIEIDKIGLQEESEFAGYTDIEILGNRLHVIIEAKRGWNFPTEAQLRLYAKRLARTKKPFSALVVMSECSREYAERRLPHSISGSRIAHLSWKDIAHLSQVKQASHAEKRLMAELRAYLGRMITMQNQELNWVYVVALSRETIQGSSLTWQDIVMKKKRYFHPADKNWPKEPPNYLGFRYDGGLRSIHHVEKWEKVDSLSKAWPLVGRHFNAPYVLYKLGKPIIPQKEVKTGNLWSNGRVWAMLDLLLTCDTILDARNKSQGRMSSQE